MKRKDNLATRFFWSNIFIIVLILLLTMGITAFVQIRDTVGYIDENISDVALIMSQDPNVLETFQNGKVSEDSMEFFDSIVYDNDSIDFLVLAGTDSIRLYHPDHSMIGKHFNGGDEGPAIEGSDMYFTDGKGSREYQRRCFVSIRDDSGKVLGFIMVSRYSRAIRRILINKMAEFIILLIIAVFLSTGITVFLSNAIRKQLLGYEPSEIARLFLQREEVLDGLTEGIILVNDKGECEYANGMAYEILGGNDLSRAQSFVDKYFRDNVLNQSESLQETIRTGDRTLLVDSLPVWNDSRYVGSLIVINDKTESIKMAAQLTGVDQIIGALRASTHETKNRMHVILGLLQIGELDEAIEFIQSAAGYDEEADRIRELIKNNTLAALLIGKRNRARELGIDLKVRKDSRLGEKSRFLSSAELVTIVGNLLENSFDAINEKEKGAREISLYINETDDVLVITVDDTGCGMTENQVQSLLRGGFTTKGENHGIGMGLIKNILKGYDGLLDIESEPGEGTSISITINRQAA